MRNKKIISISSISFFVLVLIWVYSLNAQQATDVPVCNDIYSWAIAQCLEANEKWKSREIDRKNNPICISSNDKEKIAYNVVLDIKFKELDKWIESFLESLEQNKDEYFWTESEKTVFDAVPDLNHLFADTTTWFYKQYRDACDENVILKEAAACYNPLSDKEAYKFLKNNSWDNICMSLAKTKLAVYRQVRSDLLKLNKKQVKDDYVKKHTQEQRTKYDDLLDKMSVNKNYINKINQKWNVKEANPHQ